MKVEKSFQQGTYKNTTERQIKIKGLHNEVILTFSFLFLFFNVTYEKKYDQNACSNWNLCEVAIDNTKPLRDVFAFFSTLLPNTTLQTSISRVFILDSKLPFCK